MQTTLYTIGHSNQNVARFLELMQENSVQVIVDVRSAPYSRYVLHFNKKEIEVAVIQAGLTYIYLGDVIGGKPTGSEFLDEGGCVMYHKLAAAKTFQHGLDRVIKGLGGGWTIALMCAEEDPLKCHRHHLIARELELKHGIPVWHIRANNSKKRALQYLEGQQKLFP